MRNRVNGMELLDLYFDRDGLTLTREEFEAKYPQGRELLASDRVLGVEVSTEFVGVNHNFDPLGSPHIFETIAHVDGDVVYSRWAGNEDDAIRNHRAAKWRARFGAALVWRAVYAAKYLAWRLRGRT